MSRGARAQTQQKSADLTTEFGLQCAVNWFGQEAIDSLPKYTHGPKAGQPKGCLVWLKTTSPGYCVYVSGFAPAGITVRAWIGPNGWASEGTALRGKWFGREQNLCGSRSLLTQEARDQDLKEREAVYENNAEISGEMSAQLGKAREPQADTSLLKLVERSGLTLERLSAPWLRGYDAAMAEKGVG